MAIVLDGPVTPDEGSLFVRNVPTPTNTDALDRFMPDVYDHATEFDFTVLTKTGRTARFRAYDAPAHVNGRDTMVMNRVPLIPLSVSAPVVGEQELAKLYGLAYMQDPKAVLAQSIYDDLGRLAGDIKRRASLFKGTVLSTGQIALNEGGLNGTVDFSVPSGNKLTAPVLWSHQTSGAYDADIVTFLNAARAAYIALNGFAPGKWLSSTNVLTLMQQNANLQKMAIQQIGNQLGGYQGLLPAAAVASILGNYKMPDPTVNICDARVDVDGTSTLVFPSNIIVLGPPDDQEVARFQYGPTVTAQKLVGTGNLTTVEAPGVIGFVDRGDEFPYNERSIADANGFGAITNPNLHMILTVA